jgi:HNH endonuclease
MTRRTVYPRDLLTATAAVSTSLVDMLRNLNVPVASGPRRYLRKRLIQYGIDTSHFVDEPLPARPRMTYSKERLAEAAACSHSVRGVLEYLGVTPYDSAYTHIRKRLRQFGIDICHFTDGRAGVSKQLLPREELFMAVAESRSLAGVLRALGRPNGGGGRALVRRSIAEHNISTAHFIGQGHQQGRPPPTRKSASAILQRLPPGSRRTKTAQLRRALGESGVPQICGECGISDTWRGRRLILEIDHVNGDRLDNRIDNLRYLCPSCHNQTRTFSSRKCP